MGKIKTLETYLDENNFLRETANFHLKLEKILVEEIKPVEIFELENCAEIVKDGVPILQHENFQSLALDAVEKFLPRVYETFTENILPPLPRELLKNILLQDNEKVQTYCAENNLNETLIRVLFWSTLEKIISENLKSSKLWSDKINWRKNYCPVCGRRPALAHLKKFNEGRERYLLCGGCRTKWKYLRVGCVYCGNEDLTKMHILELKKNPVRIDVCDECKNYLKTYGEDDNENIFLQDWTTLYLDLLAEEKNFHKCGAIELE